MLIVPSIRESRLFSQVTISHVGSGVVAIKLSSNPALKGIAMILPSNVQGQMSAYRVVDYCWNRQGLVCAFVGSLVG